MLAATGVVTAAAATWFVTRPEAQAPPTTAERVVYTVERRPFKAVVTLDATVVTATSVPVSRHRPTADVRWLVQTGDVVKAGQPIGEELSSTDQNGSGPADVRADLGHANRQLRRLKQLAALDIADAEQAVKDAAPRDRPATERALARTRLNAQQGMDELERQISGLKQTLAATRGDRLSVTAPVAGTVTISPEGTTATIRPTGYIVTASVDPLVLYRLLDHSGRPTAEQSIVKLTGLPTEFECHDLLLRDDTAESNGEDASPVVTAAASCRVPKEIRVFAGLTATMAITVADIPEALLLDAAGVRAVADDKGLVSRLAPNGRIESRAVELGQTDGLSVVIVSGLDEGDRVVDPASD